MNTNQSISVTAIAVQPLGVDLVAASALDTFVRKMNYESVLTALWKEEVWLLSLALEPARASGVTKSLAEGTGVFVNPNTHGHLVVRPDETLPFGPESHRAGPGIAVWAYDDSQVRPTETAVRERVGIRELGGLKRLVLWWPSFLSSGLTSRGARDVALSMVSTKSRTEGLLANPHYQGWYIIEEPLKPSALLKVVEGPDKTKGN